MTIAKRGAPDRCLKDDEGRGNNVLKEIHKEIVGRDLKSHTLSRKSYKAGYYWPTVSANDKEHLKMCDK